MLVIVVIGSVLVLGTIVYYVQKRRRKYVVMAPSRPNEYSTYVTDANLFAKPSEIDEPDTMEAETKLDPSEFVTVNPAALESDDDVNEKEALMNTEASKEDGDSSSS